MTKKAAKTPKNSKTDSAKQKRAVKAAVKKEKQKQKQKQQKKKQKKKKKQKTQTESHATPGKVMLFIVRWCLVLAVWSFLGVLGLFAYYGAEISDIIEAPHFDRKNALVFEDRHGTVIARYGELKGHTVNIQDLPSHLIYAIIATEDRRFYEHPGVDLHGITRAMLTNILRGRLSQGGSTITQQLAKNLFLSHDRTIKRKVQEIILSIWLENRLTKDEILSAYLNRVYFGSGAYGVDAASRIYFNKDVKDITVSEAALIAGLLKAPSRYSPLANPEKAKERTQTVLKLMKRQGYPVNEDMPNVIKQELSEAGNYKDNIRYFTDWVKTQVNTAHEPAGKSDDLNLTIKTTLDLPLQKKADKILQNAIDDAAARSVSQGAFIVMAHNGDILAMGGGRNYNTSQFNRATQAYRPPGSAFKPFVYLAAYMDGFNPSDTIEDTPILDQDYMPQNFNDEYHGKVSLDEALVNSMNTATVRLADKVGIKHVIKTARKLGIQAELNHDLSLSLGSSGIPLLEMVTAYGTIANKGYGFTPYAVSAEKDTKRDKAKRVVNAKAVHYLHRSLTHAVESGTGKRAADNSTQLYEAAGKTGTSQDYRDAWFIGYTDKFIAGVWLGNDDNSVMDHVTGGSAPAIIWREIMREAHKRAKDLALEDQNYVDHGFGRLIERFTLND